MGTLLKRAKSISWHELEDGSDSAAGIPALLARVAWSDEADSLLALDDLRGRICLDGIVVAEATATVVPLLWELAEAPQVPCRLKVLELLLEIWLSRQWSRAAEGAGPQHAAAYAARVVWERHAREEVRHGHEVARRLSEEADAAIAGAARELVAALKEGS